MLLPDHVYRRIPVIWLLMGCLFLIFGLAAGSEFELFWVSILMGLVSIGRSMWLFQARKRVARKGEVTVLTDTQILERNHSS